MYRLILMITLLIFVSSCEIEDALKCDIEWEERTVPCLTDENKMQDQWCIDGLWDDYLDCYECEDNETRVVACATNETMKQDQKCSWGDWVNDDICYCSDDNKFCLEHAGLSWSSSTTNTLGLVTFSEAKEYCNKLGGRIPTIDEVRTLIQNCPATESGGECRIVKGCLYSDPDDPNNCWNESCKGCDLNNATEYSIFGDRWLWTKSNVWDKDNSYWTVNFHHASLGVSKSSNINYARCVK